MVRPGLGDHSGACSYCWPLLLATAVQQLDQDPESRLPFSGIGKAHRAGARYAKGYESLGKLLHPGAFHSAACPAALSQGQSIRLPQSGVLFGGLCHGGFLPPDGHVRGKCASSLGKSFPLAPFWRHFDIFFIPLHLLLRKTIRR